MKSVKDVYFSSSIWVASRPWLMGILLASFSGSASAASCSTFNTGAFSGFTDVLASVASFLSGGFGKAAVLIAICIFGALMMFGELKGVFSVGIKILFGGSLILMATQWAGLFTNFFGSGVCSYISS